MTILDIKAIQAELEQEEHRELQDHEEAEGDEPEARPNEVVLGPVEGTALVIRRLLQAQKSQDDQREKIFQTRWLVMGKVCPLIIDRGSETNVASQGMINKLSQPTYRHPKPYKFHWLNEYNFTKVSRRASIAISFGDAYTNHIAYDIILMDACHILLGKLWQYDTDTSHNSRKNTYNFKINNKIITLAPSPPLSQNTPKGSTKNHITLNTSTPQPQ